MKCAGQLMQEVVTAENLRLAFWKAAKGNRAKTDCRAFEADLDGHLEALRVGLASGTTEFGNYRHFRIRDPKPRLICAAAFVERVAHHALMNLCEPILERAAVFDSYACRKGKGRLAAVDRARHFARQHEWFLKLDVRKYFDSIDHATLMEMLGRKFKDPTLLGLFSRIVASYETVPGKGLPIGNLTSQHFANFYLGPLDRFCKEALRRTAYVRYMDDVVVWGESGAELRHLLESVTEYAREQLRLSIKESPIINRTQHGMDFLGYRIYPHDCRLARRSKVRFIRKLRDYERAFETGAWTELELQHRVQALLAFVMSANSRGFRWHVVQRSEARQPGAESESKPPASTNPLSPCPLPNPVPRFASKSRGEGDRKKGVCQPVTSSMTPRFGVVADGLEPRDPRGQLEQRRPELPVGVSQQQHARQPEQQHWVPRRPGPSSVPGVESTGNDPAATLSCDRSAAQANTAAPPGASTLNGVQAENSGRRFARRLSGAGFGDGLTPLARMCHSLHAPSPWTFTPPVPLPNRFQRSDGSGWGEGEGERGNRCGLDSSMGVQTTQL